jgi:hypothetical protein
METNGTIRMVLRLVEEDLGSEIDMAALKSIAASLHSLESHGGPLPDQIPQPALQAADHAGHEGRQEQGGMPPGWEHGEIAVLAVAVLEACHVPFLHNFGGETPLVVQVCLRL